MRRFIGIIGCGWLGRALASRLVSSGSRVVATTATGRSTAALEALGAETLVVGFEPDVRGDVAGLRDVDALVVAVPPGRGLDPVAQARSIAGVVATTRAGHVVQISTTSVYPSERRRVVEDDATPEHPLRLVEGVFRDAGRVTTVLRCAGLYGPGRLILPYVLRAGVAVDEGTPVNLVEQLDVVRAVVEVLETPVPDVFNLCADEHPTKGAFYREIARRSGMDAPHFASTGEAWKIVDNTKFRERYAFEYAFPDPLQFPV
jgi:nucleoside-diphosphate-sugar epimerase